MNRWILKEEDDNKDKNDTDDGGKGTSNIIVSNTHIYFYSIIKPNTILKLNKELKELSSSLYYQSLEEERPATHIKLHIHSDGGKILPALAA